MFGHSDNQQDNGQSQQNDGDNQQHQDNNAPQEGSQPANNDYNLNDIPAGPIPATDTPSNPFTQAPQIATAPVVVPEPTNDPAQVHQPVTPTQSSDLLDLKQKALHELSPLVSHLDQNPEEKFKTTMMMIQASDNQALLADAYEAAQAITDQKAKAQALLDVVNEINYFTQAK